MDAQVTPELLESAGADAAAAADRAGVQVRGIGTPEESEEAAALICEVWQVPPDGCIVDANTMVALAHSGNYVAAAYAGRPQPFDPGAQIAVREDMIGAALGWFAAEQGRPPGRVLHSHIAGVRPGLASKGVGFALKVDQRRWCLERGVELVTWTFDPLVARNAHFNVARLGVHIASYRVNQYGTMRDGLNAGQQSDRIVCAWDLTAPVGGRAPADLPDGPLVIAAEPDGGPTPVQLPTEGASVCRVAIPADAESLTRSDPDAHGRWRLAVREAVTELLDTGWSVVGFDGPAAHYVFERTP